MTDVKRTATASGDEPNYAHTCMAVVHAELDARWRLALSETIRIELMKTVVEEVFTAYMEGDEFVGAMGGLQYNPDTKEWA